MAAFSPDTGNAPSPTWQVLLPVSSSEAVSLKGKPAKTPIIAGTICGVAVLLGWIIGFTVYWRKRSRRKKLVAAGLASAENKRKEAEQKIIIPPDPAVVLGQHRPGEYVIPPSKSSSKRPSLDSRPPSQYVRGNSARPSLERSHSALVTATFTQAIPTPSRHLDVP